MESKLMYLYAISMPDSVQTQIAWKSLHNLVERVFCWCFSSFMKAVYQCFYSALPLIWTVADDIKVNM